MRHSEPPFNTEASWTPASDSRRTAFTLVELLVTLAVVGVLLALLLPALTRAKAKAKEALCTNNLRQINSGIHLYLADNGGRFPAGFRWAGGLASVWNSNEFIGGRDGRDTNFPPARVRPLYPYLGASEVFRCPADVGFDDKTKGGVLVKPSMFEVAGLSYHYNAGELLEGAPQSTDGLGGKTVEWVKRPAQYALMYEPPAKPSDEMDHPGAYCVYWHRARRPGSALGYADDECGPRVSPFLFVDGHIQFIDCSYTYWGLPPGAEERQ